MACIRFIQLGLVIAPCLLHAPWFFFFFMKEQTFPMQSLTVSDPIFTKQITFESLQNWWHPTLLYHTLNIWWWNPLKWSRPQWKSDVTCFVLNPDAIFVRSVFLCFLLCGGVLCIGCVPFFCCSGACWLRSLALCISLVMPFSQPMVSLKSKILDGGIPKLPTRNAAGALIWEVGNSSCSRRSILGISTEHSVWLGEERRTNVSLYTLPPAGASSEITVCDRKWTLKKTQLIEVNVPTLSFN